ncbi:MAG TPA: extracellular solute-binding protein [Candidatus Stackebrandtia excrementipullorum]|nr:extracellular solute-binding protein [Candidatus Stackebrandtia excrementipullorum]
MKFPNRRVKSGVAAVAALTLAGGLVACSDSSSAADDGKLVIANYQFLEPGRGDQLWDGLLEYENHNTEATLEQSASPYLQYVDKLNTELGAGGGPDVFVVQEAQFATLAEAGVLASLNDAVTDSGLNDLNEGLNVDGEQLGVIWEQVTYALIGNKNLMEEAGVTELPTDVDGLIAASQQIQENTEADGFAVRHLMSEFDSWWMDYNVFPYGYNGSWSNGSELTLDTAENIAGLEAYRDIYDAGVMPIGDDASTFRTKFKENQLGFMIENNGATLSFTSGGQITGSDIVSGPLPFDHPGQHQRIVFAVNKNSDNVDLAKDFINWFVSEEGQTAIRPGLGASTLATDVPLTDEFEGEHPWAPVFLDQAATSRSNLIEGFETDTKAVMQIVMRAVERVITQGQDPAEALGEAQAEAESSIR